MKREITLNNGKKIAEHSSPYFIAEINSSHFGDLNLAKDMITLAAEAKVDCVKFQSWTSESLYSSSYYIDNPIAKRFVDKFSLQSNDLKTLSEFTNKIGLDFASTPYSEEEVIFLIETCKVPFIKIASMEINNHRYLEFIAKTGSAIILSTGMSTIDEIVSAVDIIKSSGNTNLCVLHCVSVYPCPLDEVNLNNIYLLREKLPSIPIGYSDHTLDSIAAIAATSLGVAVIEKHFTLDSKKIGMDNQMASEPAIFQDMIKRSKEISAALGNKDRHLGKEELSQREQMRRSIVSSSFIPAGKKIREEDINFKRPGTGFKPTEINKVLGSIAVKDIEKDHLILPSDINQSF